MHEIRRGTARRLGLRSLRPPFQVLLGEDDLTPFIRSVTLTNPDAMVTEGAPIGMTSFLVGDDHCGDDHCGDVDCVDCSIRSWGPPSWSHHDDEAPTCRYRMSGTNACMRVSSRQPGCRACES